MGRLMTASCRASFVVIALIVASAGVVHQPAPSVRAASSPATLKAGGLNRPRGFVPRVHMGPQGSPRSNAASPNPNCSQCAPPLLLTRNYPVIGGLTGTPGHVTITPYFWEPPSYSYVSTTYLKLIDRYTADVAQASQTNNNVFSVATQYYQQDTAQGAPQLHLAYAVTKGNEVVDTNGYPASGGSGCTPAASFTACVTDGALQSELTSRLNALGLPIDDSHIYMAFFPSGVETCEGPNTISTVKCSASDYCAYHSDTSSAPYLIYANLPFPDLKYCVDTTNGAQAPNGDAYADTEISLISHEASEANTDGTPGGSGVSSTHLYCSPGTYNVGLAVTDSSGWSSSIMQQVSVAEGVPIINVVAPGVGRETGGTNVTIKGCAFTGVTGVKFGGTDASSVQLVSDQQITAVTPAHSLGTVDITMTSSSGTSAVSTADRVTFVLNGVDTLDAYGGIHPADSSGVSVSGYWAGWQIAKTAKPWPGKGTPQAGMVLDGFGGLHPFGSPTLQVGQEPYYLNHDVARDFVFLPDGTGGYELDGYGGIHPFSIGSNAMPAAAGQYPYFPGQDLAKKITLLPD